MSLGPGGSTGVDWIQCDDCNSWVDYALSGLPQPYVERNVKKMKYSCRLCIFEKKLESVAGENTALKARVTALEEGSLKGSKLYSDMARIPTELDAVKQSLTALGSSSGTGALTAPQLRQATDEAAETKKRELNLIISGLEEGNDDLQTLINYAGLCKVHLTKEDIEGSARLGRVGPKPRLLRIKLRSALKRKSLLTMRLADRPDIPQIFIRPDLTKAQQEIDKMLRDELTIVGKDKYMIRRGKIVPRPPLDLAGEGTVRGPGGSGGVSGGVAVGGGGVERGGGSDDTGLEEPARPVGDAGTGVGGRHPGESWTVVRGGGRGRGAGRDLGGAGGGGRGGGRGGGGGRPRGGNTYLAPSNGRMNAPANAPVAVAPQPTPEVSHPLQPPTPPSETPALQPPLPPTLALRPPTAALQSPRASHPTQPLSATPMIQAPIAMPLTQSPKALPTPSVTSLTQPSAEAPGSQPSSAIPLTQPLGTMPSTHPLNPIPLTQPLNPSPSTQPLNPTPLTQPLNPTPVTQSPPPISLTQTLSTTALTHPPNVVPLAQLLTTTTTSDTSGPPPAQSDQPSPAATRTRTPTPQQPIPSLLPSGAPTSAATNQPTVQTAGGASTGMKTRGGSKPKPVSDAKI